MMFKYGYIFYRDSAVSKNDNHVIIDLIDEVASLTEKIDKIQDKGEEGDGPRLGMGI